MKKFMNFSKFVFSTLLVSSLFVACSEEITETTCDSPYTANASNIRNAGQAVDLGLPSGTKWANMNVGATSETDNGLLFVWGDITGTQLLASSATTYTDATSAKSLEQLFNQYKGSLKDDGAISDTTHLTSLAEPLMIDLSFIPADTTSLDSLGKAAIDVQKMDAINDFVKGRLENMKQSNPGFLEATLVNEGFTLIYDWDDAKSEFVQRLPLADDATERDILDYYKKFEYTSFTNFTIDMIGTTQVSYYDSPYANNYEEEKDLVGKVVRKNFVGGDIPTPVYSIVADAAHDPATANWGSGWQMPTAAQIQELLSVCSWEFTGTGYRVTGPNKNSIFLPAAGYRYGDKMYGNGNSGYYACGEISGSYHFPSMTDQISGGQGEVNASDNMPNVLIFQHGQFVNDVNIYNNLSSSFGVSIRPVASSAR